MIACFSRATYLFKLLLYDIIKYRDMESESYYCNFPLDFYHSSVGIDTDTYSSVGIHSTYLLLVGSPRKTPSSSYGA